MSVPGTNSPRHKFVFNSEADALAFDERTAGLAPRHLGARRPELRGPAEGTYYISNESGLPCYWQLDQKEGTIPAKIVSNSSKRLDLILKRTLDLLIAGGAILALLPMFLLVALAIKVSDPSGPVLFRQPRQGLGGKLFWIFKFRSMYHSMCSLDGVEQTSENDTRVMPVGAMLRKLNIDEMPQLLNIILGDMSLVGPRPHVAGQLANGKPYADLVPYYEDRFQMRPGITGWAQANGYRGPTNDPALARARIDHDLAYVQNFSIALDARILLKTLKQEFVGGNGF